MKTISISPSDFQIIKTCYNQLNLRKINIAWDGRGSLLFEFDPPLLDVIMEEQMIEIFSDLMSQIDMIWNVDMEFNFVYSDEIKIDYVEVRNISSYEDDLMGQITNSINSQELIQHLSDTYGITLDDSDYQISYQICGNSEGEHWIDNFTLYIFTDDEVIEINDSITQELAGNVLHQLMIGLGPSDYAFEYESDMDTQSPDLTIRLEPASIKLTIAH